MPSQTGKFEHHKNQYVQITIKQAISKCFQLACVKVFYYMTWVMQEFNFSWFIDFNLWGLLHFLFGEGIVFLQDSVLYSWEFICCTYSL